jgi:glycine/D-amino acid oxidase-like deaminating enzyme
MRSTADVVICGCGIAGAAAAYHIAVRRGIRNVAIVDEREPLTLTSDKGTQAYRNWWPGPDDTMLRLVSRSIDLLEETSAESGHAFRLNRRGYLFATASPDKLAQMEETARRVSSFGMGEVRRHSSVSTYRPAPAEGFDDQPSGADLLIGDSACAAFPYLAEDTAGALHVRRAGWLSAVALGSWLLSQAVANGARFVREHVTRVDTAGGRVREVHFASGNSITTGRLVVAAGPGLPAFSKLLGVDLPVFSELHAKMTLHDPRRAVGRDAPFLIWTDPVHLEGEAEARPAGVHVRPIDLGHGDELYLIWTFETEPREFSWPPSFDESYGDVVLRGAARMVPGLAAYVAEGAAANGFIDGGFYCKTPENRPLIGPLPIEGAYVLGALSGMGVMSAHASGELVSLHVAGESLPSYAKWFLPSRYDDPAYRKLVDEWGPLVGQL